MSGAYAYEIMRAAGLDWSQIDKLWAYRQRRRDRKSAQRAEQRAVVACVEQILAARILIVRRHYFARELVRAGVLTDGGR